MIKRVKVHLNKFGLVAAALGLAFGHTASELISTLVSNLIMPILSLAFGVDDWQTHILQIGSLELKWGEVFKDMIRFLIISVSVIYILHWLNLEENEKEVP
ncbi:MscL family protein [Amylibacter sp.]|jgi:large-conductance mechanosensitive channel|nr:MscL family protein [Amylibacter sp.]